MSEGTKAIVLRIDKFQALNVLSGIRSPRYTHTFQRWARQACRLCTFLKHFRCLFPTARSTEIRLEAFKQVPGSHPLFLLNFPHRLTLAGLIRTLQFTWPQ